MSVRTRADNQLDNAKDSIKAAIIYLEDIVYERCWGAEDYSREYMDIMRSVHSKLQKQLYRLEQ